MFPEIQLDTHCGYTAADEQEQLIGNRLKSI